MKVFSLVAEEGSPRHLQALQSDYWFRQRGYEVIPFHREQLSAGEFDVDLRDFAQETLVFASVAVVREAILRAGRPEPPNIDFPSGLTEFVGREIWDTTMAEVKSWEQSYPFRLPVHVKPRDHHKLFTGKVISAFRDLIGLAGVPDDEPLIAQEVVEFVSEWRASVLRGKIVHVGHYKGDPLEFPSAATMRLAVTKFTDAPIGYGMDWGVTRDGRTLLVEVNDGFALGNYGVPGYLYTALIECRWRQLMGLDDNGVGQSM